MHLNGNLINDESVSTFADVLTKNMKLTKLDLDQNNDITAVEQLALLKLVCDGSSINGVINFNHTLQSLGYYNSSDIRFDD